MDLALQTFECNDKEGLLTFLTIKQPILTWRLNFPVSLNGFEYLNLTKVIVLTQSRVLKNKSDMKWTPASAIPRAATTRNQRHYVSLSFISLLLCLFLSASLTLHPLLFRRHRKEISAIGYGQIVDLGSVTNR